MSGVDDALREELSALVDGALEEPRASELRARLAADAELRAEYEALSSVAEAVRGLPRERAPEALAARVRAGLPRARRLPLLFGAAAALAAGVLVAIAVHGPSAERERAARLAKTEAPRADSEPVAQAPPRASVGPPGAVPSGARDAVEADEREAAEEERAKRRGAAKEAHAEEEAALSPARAAAPVRTVEERAAYFARLRAMKPEELRRHIEGFALPSQAEARDARAEAVLRNLEEAEAVRALLLAAFPRKEEQAARLGASAPTAAAEVAPARWRGFALSLDAPPASRAGVRGWLAHLSTGAPPRPPPPSPDSAAAAAEAARAEDAPMELKLHFPVPDGGK